MEKRTQPRLEWKQGSCGVWVADCGSRIWARITPITVNLGPHELSDEAWWRSDFGLHDNVDAMIFAEERALELCKAMFGKLLEADNG